MASLIDHLVLLGVASLLVFAPGAGVARVFGIGRSLPETLAPAVAFAFSVTLLSVVTLLTLTLHLPIAWNAALYCAGGLAAIVASALRRWWTPRDLGRWAGAVPSGVWIVVAAIVLLSFVVGGSLMSDSLYHAAQALKLARLDHPTLSNTLQYPDGGPHPGYLLPVWQQMIALVSWVARVDVLLVMKDFAAITVPLGAMTVGGLAQVALRSRLAAPLGALAFALAQAVETAPAFNPISNAMQPGELVVNVAIPLAVASLLVAVWGPVALGDRAAGETRSARSDPRAVLVLAVATALTVVVHVSYVYFLGIAVAGYLLLWMLAGPLTGAAVRAHTIAGATVALVAAAGVGALLPTLHTLRTFNHEGGAGFAKSFGSQFDRADGAQVGVLFVGSLRHYHLRADYLVWFGGLALLGLCCIALAPALRRLPGMWYLAGATMLILLLSQSDVLFPQLVAITSPAQARRLDQALPVSLGLTLGLVLLARWLQWLWHRARVLALPLAACATAAVFTLVDAYPKLPSRQSPPEIPAWPIMVTMVALAAGAVVVLVIRIVSGLRLAPGASDGARWRDSDGVRITPAGAVAAALVLLIGSAPAISRALDAIRRDLDTRPASVARMDELRDFDDAVREGLRRLPEGSVVMADPRTRTSFRLMALAPLYVVSSVPGHTANTPRNRVEQRWSAAVRFYDPGTSPTERASILDRDHVTAVIVECRNPNIEWGQSLSGASVLASGDHLTLEVVAPAGHQTDAARGASSRAATGGTPRSCDTETRRG